MIGSLSLLWASAMRRRYNDSAQSLDTDTIAQLRAWFDTDLLASVRVARPDRVRLIGAGPARLLPIRALPLQPAGICLGRLIVIKADTPRELNVLFHELVHTTQWETLGGRRFLSHYVREVLDKGYEDKGGLEESARTMTARFTRGERFDVQHEVRVACLHPDKGGV